MTQNGRRGFFSCERSRRASSWRVYSQIRILRIKREIQGDDWGQTDHCFLGERIQSLFNLQVLRRTNNIRCSEKLQRCFFLILKEQIVEDRTPDRNRLRQCVRHAFPSSRRIDDYAPTLLQSTYYLDRIFQQLLGSHRTSPLRRKRKRIVKSTYPPFRPTISSTCKFSLRVLKLHCPWCPSVLLKYALPALIRGGIYQLPQRSLATTGN